MIQSINIHLNERERLILKATIEDYIETMHPIGSNYLKTCHHFTFSPATIRNTLAQLEQKGLLTHPHTSSGRIPTDSGYRYFVDELLDKSNINVDECRAIEQSLVQVADNVDELMQAAASMLAQVSRMFGVVMIRHYQESILKDIELVALSSERVMMVLAMKSGLIRSITLNLKVRVNHKMLESVTVILKERLLDLSLKEIQQTINERLRDTEIYEHEVVQILINDPIHHFSNTQNSIIYQSTLIPLLEQPEFQDVGILQKTIIALDSQRMMEYLSEQIGDERNSIFIGNENENINLDHCSLISSRFNSNDLMGQLVILGPTRISYQNILMILKQFTEIMTDVC
ncbi:MAG: heat-inducible transcription repressor HrcA [Candidatus Marinimicrobia bacterium]|nr:heat-inducible transcription repressor HrcA [Candidatus Neomarinimicrobiota bacterium]